MYYLDCVATLIELDNPNLNRLRNFQNYYFLNDVETDALLTLVVLLSPDELIGKIFSPKTICPRITNSTSSVQCLTCLLYRKTWSLGERGQEWLKSCTSRGVGWKITTLYPSCHSRAAWRGLHEGCLDEHPVHQGH